MCYVAGIGFGMTVFINVKKGMFRRLLWEHKQVPSCLKVRESHSFLGDGI